MFHKLPINLVDRSEREFGGVDQGCLYTPGDLSGNKHARQVRVAVRFGRRPHLW